MAGEEHRERLEVALGELVAAARAVRAAGVQRPNEPVSLEFWRAKRTADEASMRFAQAVNMFLGTTRVEERQA